MNDLEKYFKNNDKRVIDKWIHYFEIYDRHFSKFRNTDVVIVEVGVFHGGSLQMWKDYFGNKAKIFGIDINPNCKEAEEENVQIFIGSQTDRKFLGDLRKKLPPVDILIDDGGHTMKQQIVFFEELYETVKPGGVYLCEDLHTSYWMRYGGGHKRRSSFIEYSKNFIDNLNAFHSEQRSLKETKFTNTTDSLHYYDSVLVIEKENREKPHHELTGSIEVSDPVLKEGSFIERARSRWDYLRLYYDGYLVKHIFLFVLNKILKFLRLRNFRW